MSEITVSVVVPVLNEIAALPVTMAALLREDFAEIIVVDGGSTDGTRELVAACADGRVQLIDSVQGRGCQLNAGARHATGDCLLFHHADTVLPASAVATLRAALTMGASWGGFRHRFSNAGISLNIISWLHNLRCRLSGVVYGDQSMFVTRTTFDQVGGFAEAELEDLAFSDAALRYCRSTLLPDTVVTDSRKFVQIGPWRALGQVVSIVWRYERGRAHGHTGFFGEYR